MVLFSQHQFNRVLNHSFCISPSSSQIETFVPVSSLFSFSDRCVPRCETLQLKSKSSQHLASSYEDIHTRTTAMKIRTRLSYFVFITVSYLQAKTLRWKQFLFSTDVSSCPPLPSHRSLSRHAWEMWLTADVSANLFALCMHESDSPQRADGRLLNVTGISVIWGHRSTRLCLLIPLNRWDS